MMQFLKEKIKNFKYWEIALVLLIVVIGIFLRAYNFSDWIRFNDDQVRDAWVVDRMISGEEFPLLGPKAGGTTFNLGPVFYYFEYLSGLIFGETPVSSAYPVLFFSILSIPLFYLIFKNIFGKKVSFLLTIVYVFSFFAIKYSRFAWNMNLVPFFVMVFIFVLAKFYSEKNPKRNIIWAILLGLIIGIGVQLHTLLMVCFPATFLGIFFIDFLRKERIDYKKIILIISLAVVLNLSLAIHDIKNQGENFKAFVNGINSKTGTETQTENKFVKNISCQIQGISFALSAYGKTDECNIFQKDKEANLWIYRINIWVSVAFFISGIFLLFFFGLRKKYFWNNIFFRIIFLYFGISFLLFIPLSGEISLRMFVVVIVMPFLFLGLWIKLLQAIIGKYAYFLAALLVVFLLGTNLLAFKETYLPLGDNYREDRYFGGTSLGELKKLANYIIQESVGFQQVNISKFVSSRSLEYLIERRGLSIETIGEDEIASNDVPLFFLKRNELKVNKKKDKTLQSDLAGFVVLDSKMVGHFTVFKLEAKK